EDANAEDIQMDDHLRPMKELLQIPIIGAAETWLENEPPCSITTWDDLVSKFLNRFYPHSKTRELRKEIMNFQQVFDEEQEPETITEVVEIPSSQSTPLPLIPYPSRLQNDKFQALENPTGRADHFVYRIDIVDSLCVKFPIEKNSLSGNPTPSSNSVVESLSPLPTPCGDSDSLVEETDTLLSYFNDSSPDYETFCFDIEEKSSGSTTPHSDHSLPEYESFCFDVDHIEEKSSGNTTSHYDLSFLEYESFHFDLSIDQLPLADRSDSQHEEFADELAHIISPPEYDHFYFDLEPDPGELTIVLKKNISDTLTKDLKMHELNDFPLFLSDCDSIFSKKFSEIDLLVLFPPRNKDKVFDPGIFTINRVHSKRFSILLLDDFSSILFVRDFLFMTDPSEIETFLSFPSGNKDKVFDPGILLNDEVFSFPRKYPHLLIDNFMIDNCYILSEISLKSISFISFHPKDKEIRGDFDPFLEIPSGESKVHIEVLSVLWGNRLPIPDGLLPLFSSRCLSLQKGQGNYRGRNTTTVSSRFAPDVAVV
ncbi:reverse transcriptase domain-containing protein, partial [Tanacetum coccineum]